MSIPMHLSVVACDMGFPSFSLFTRFPFFCQTMWPMQHIVRCSKGINNCGPCMPQQWGLLLRATVAANTTAGSNSLTAPKHQNLQSEKTMID